MIEKERYKTVSDYIDSMIEQEEDIAYHFYQMKERIAQDASVVGSLFFSQEYKAQIEEAYSDTVNLQIIKSPTLEQAVYSLQNHIFQETGDVNQWLSDNNILLKPRFSRISNVKGFSIDEDNYEYFLLKPGNEISMSSDGKTIVFDGRSGDSATLNILPDSFALIVIDGNFIFDYGGSQEHTFTTIGESITISISDATSVDLTWQGMSSFKFQLSNKY